MRGRASFPLPTCCITERQCTGKTAGDPWFFFQPFLAAEEDLNEAEKAVMEQTDITEVRNRLLILGEQLIPGTRQLISQKYEAMQFTMQVPFARYGPPIPKQ